MCGFFVLYARKHICLGRDIGILPAQYNNQLSGY